MLLNDFSSLIQLAVSVNIAFVAVEYVKSYVKVLCDSVFKFKDYINLEFEECKKFLVDGETLKHLEPIDLAGKSTSTEIEGHKRSYELIVKKIADKQKELSDKVENICKARSMSALSLTLFFIGTIGLFVSGFEDKNNTYGNINMYWHQFWIYTTILTLLYLIIGWIFGETSIKYRCFDFSSLRHSICSSFLIVILSSGLALFNFKILNNDILWKFFLIISLLMMFSNFLVFVIKVWKKAKGVKSEISDSANCLSQECKDLTSEVKDLLTVAKVKNKLSAE